jgi:hypothetical protein
VGRVWPRHGHRGRPLNSVVRLHVEAPSLEVTPAAVEAIRREMSSIAEYQPIAVLSWVVGTSWGELLPNGEENITVLGPHWDVGYHSRAKLPPEEIFEISGIPITFGAPTKMMHWLSGATLDYIGGRFEVQKRAI